MRKIIKVSLIHNDDRELFHTELIHKLKEGYEIQGTVQICSKGLFNSKIYMCATLFKYKELPKEGE